MQHPGPGFEREKEIAARKRCAVLLKDPNKLTAKIDALSDDYLGSGDEPETVLQKVREESASHLGNCYYCEARLAKPIPDAALAAQLDTVREQSRARHDFLMGVAGRLIAIILTTPANRSR
jgi:hypothetical protein